MRGTSFVVTIPFGNAHLPADRIRRRTGHELDGALGRGLRGRGGALAAARSCRLRTAIDIVITAPSSATPSMPTTVSRERAVVVVADDNADMREYLSHLLRPEYDVVAVESGKRAVEAARRLRPALLLTDVMMPEMDGFSVLKEVRQDASLAGMPVILLSARAGEESRVEGLQAGADDYLVKPFTARELLARIGTHVKIAALRREGEQARRLYDTILSNTPDLAYVFDRNHRFIYANKALLGMWGRSMGGIHRQELPGAWLSRLARCHARTGDRPGHCHQETNPR